MAKKKSKTKTLVRATPPDVPSDAAEIQIHAGEYGYEPTPAGFQSFNLGTLLPSWAWVNDPRMITGAADALSVTALWRAVTLIGGILGSMPLHVFRDDDRLDEPRLITRPEVEWEFAATMMRMTHDLFVFGETYALTDSTVTVDGQVDQIFVLDAGNVDVKRVNGRLVFSYGSSVLPRDETIRTVWVARPGHDRGIGLLETFGDRGLSFAKTMQSYAQSTFAESAVPSVVIKTSDEDQTFQEAQELKSAWMRQFSGRREPAVLNNADLVPTSFSPESAQLALMWDQSVREVSLMTGIPGRYLNVSGGDSMTYSNVESERRDLVDLAVMPFATRIERMFSDLLPRGQKARFSFDSFLRGSTQERYATYALSAQIEQMTGRPVLTNDEIRELEHRKPLPEPEPEPVPAPLALLQNDEEGEESA